MYRSLKASLLLLFVTTLTGCVNVTTETGSVEQRQRSAEIRAADLRADWAAMLEQAGPAQVGLELANLTRRVANVYQEYAAQISGHWREGNEGRGTPISGSEMQQRVPNWVAGEAPVLKAYDDMVDFAYTRLRESQFFDADDTRLYEDLVANYDKLYSTVVLPQGTVEDYEYEVDVLVSRVEGLAGEMELAMQRYR